MKNMRHWLYAALALTGGIIGGAIASRIVPADGSAIASTHGMHSMKEIRAQSFILTDTDGTERGIFHVNSRGVAAVELDDAEGHDRAEFRVGNEGTAAVTFYDLNGAKRVQLGSSPTGRDGLALFANDGRQLAGFTVAEDNQSSVTLYDPKTGVARVGLGVAANGEPALALFDVHGRDRAELHVNAQGKPGLALADEAGKTTSGLPMEENNQVQAPSPQ